MCESLNVTVNKCKNRCFVYFLSTRFLHFEKDFTLFYVVIVKKFFVCLCGQIKFLRECNFSTVVVLTNYERRLIQNLRVKNT